MGTVVDKLKSAGQETSLSPPATRREKTAPTLSVSVLKAMLRCIGSVSATRLRAFIHSLNPNHASSVTPKKAYCSSASEKEVLFTTPSSVPLVYRFIGASVYSQVLASLVYIEQMLFPSSPSKYSWGVQLSFASALVSISCTVPMVYWFAIRRNIFEVAILRSERQLVLRHLSKTLQMVETKVSLDDIVPVGTIRRNLRLLVNKRETSTMDSVYLERRGKYFNRPLLEEIAKGLHSNVAVNVAESASKTSIVTPGKYAVRKKTIKKDSEDAPPAAL